MPKRSAQPQLSSSGEQALERYATALREGEDIRPVTLRNYLSDLRQFAAWYEDVASAGQELTISFAFGPQQITTPTVTRYRDYLQHICELKPASVNRALISIKRYCAWALMEGEIGRDPTRGVKMVGQEVSGTASPVSLYPPLYLTYQFQPPIAKISLNPSWATSGRGFD